MNAPHRFCVVVTQQAHAELVSDLAAASRNGTRIVASGRLSLDGPGVFGPTHGSAPQIAGQGVANPSGMLLAASLMLGEGLGERAAARTLERAVSHALASGARTADLEGTRPGRDDQGLHGHRARPDARCPHRRRVPPGAGVNGNGADAVLRSLEAEGVDTVFGLPGGAILPIYDALARGTTLRHVLARHEQGAGHMAEGYARASGQGRRRVRDLGAGRDQSRHADRRRLDGLDAARLRHRPGAQPSDRYRRLPGVRHHRCDDADRQALVARAGRRGDPGGHEGGVPRRPDRPLRPGARRHPTRHPGGGARLPVPGPGRPARLAATDARPPPADRRGGPADRGRRASPSSTSAVAR